MRCFLAALYLYQVIATARRNRRDIRDSANPPRAKFQNCVPDHVVRLGLLGQRHHHPARADDPNLLARNFSHRVSQKLLVIERDIGNHADSRFDHVGRIQSPAHAYFEDGDLHLLARKMFKCNRRHHLEKTGKPRQLSLLHRSFRRAVDFSMQPREIVVADFLTIHADAFVDPHQMRRSVKPRLQPRCAQDRSQRCRGRAFAVRPRDQHARKSLLGMLHRLEQHAHMRQIELMRRRLRQFVPQRKHARDRGFVGHRAALSF